MENFEQPHIQFEAAWCVATIATGYRAQIEFLVSKGLFKALSAVLCNPYEAIFEQGAWIVANVAAEDFKYKKEILSNMGQTMLVNKLNTTKDVKVIKYTVWALSNLLRGGNFHYCQLVISPIFMKIISEQNDIEILSNCLIPIADIMNDHLVEVMTKTRYLRRLRELTKFKYNSIVEPLVKIFRHFSSSSDERHVNELIENKIIDEVFVWLADDKISDLVKREILWMLSNITVGPDPHIGVVLKSKEHYDLVAKFCYHENLKLRKEALFCLCCVTNQGTFQRKRGLIKNNIFKVIGDNLDVVGHSGETLAIMIEAMGNILKSEKTMAEHFDEILLVLEDLGIFDKLENLERHDDNVVYLKVCELIENYLGEEENNFGAIN